MYTGNGKGKTTAAIGLAIRSIGAGMNVYFGQFMKDLAYSEQKILQGFAPKLKLQTNGKPYFIAEEGTISQRAIEELGDKIVVYPKGKPPIEYVKLIEEGIEKVKEAVKENKYQVIILDEINVALYFGLTTREKVEELLNFIPKELEVVCTGRNAPQWLEDRADLVTEMKLIKHYYDKGVLGRKGIED